MNTNDTFVILKRSIPVGAVSIAILSSKHGSVAKSRKSPRTLRELYGETHGKQWAGDERREPNSGLGEARLVLRINGSSTSTVQFSR